MESMVSPWATVMAVPPSHVQWPVEAGLEAETVPVTSGGAGEAAECAGLGAYQDIPLPPAAKPEFCELCAPCGGSGWLSTRPTGAPWPPWIEPVISGAFLSAKILSKILSLNRDVSPLQPAMPAPTSANTAAWGKGRNH